MKNLLLSFSPLKRFIQTLDNFNQRREFVKSALQGITAGNSILDAGAGSQQFREYCSHLNYKAQDFGQYKIDNKKMLGCESGGLGAGSGYQYGKLDYVGNCWEIAEEDGVFDAILCTEVFEHIPYPVETVREFARLLKKDGVLILTAPSNCLRHMDPYFFYSGFSDRWFEKILKENGFLIETLEPVGDYYRWMAVEIYRTMKSHTLFSKVFLLPAFCYYYLKKENEVSLSTLCMGYHVLAKKI
jgi:SAM-dependent methyltransferase